MAIVYRTRKKVFMLKSLKTILALTGAQGVGMCLRLSVQIHPLEIIPYHTVDWGVKRLPLSPKYWEHKAVKAEPKDAHNRGPTQPDVAVDLFLNLFGVQMTGALIRITQFTVASKIRNCFLTWELKVHFHPQKRVGWSIKNWIWMSWKKS